MSTRSIIHFPYQNLHIPSLWLSFVFALMPTLLSAQNIDGGNFEDLDACTYTPSNGTFPGSGVPFQNGCVNGDWFVSHGTPEILYAFSNHWASMWAGNRNQGGVPSNSLGEGLFLYCQFNKDQVYEISFSLSSYEILNGNVSTTFVDNVRMYLTDNLNHNTNTSVTTPVGASYQVPYVANKQSIWGLSDFGDQNWSNFSVRFIPDANYTDLWIYPEDTDNGWSNLHLDNVVAVTCPSVVVYSNVQTPSTLPKYTSASNRIEANSTTGLVRVLANNEAHFRAAKNISLLPGFIAEAGSIFSAQIAPCGVFDCAVSDGFLNGPDNWKSTNNIRGSSEETPELILFPNPATTTVRGSLNGFSVASEVLLRVNDLHGRLIYTNRVANLESFSFDIQDFPSGTYVVELLADGLPFRRLLVVGR